MSPLFTKKNFALNNNSNKKARRKERGAHTSCSVSPSSTKLLATRTVSGVEASDCFWQRFELYNFSTKKCGPEPLSKYPPKWMLATAANNANEKAGALVHPE